MIDTVHLSADIAIPLNAFQQRKWIASKTIDGECYIQHRRKGVRINYYPDRQRIHIRGKILRLLHDTDVLNVDDLYGTNLELFLDQLDEYLNALFLYPLIQIRTFQVKRIDYCFNIKTPYVGQYLSFLNTAFDCCNNSCRVNYVRKKNLNGSVYVKTRSDYQNNTLRNYVLNFYDKANRLAALESKGQRVRSEDILAARNVLRLEVQCGYQFIKRLCKAQHTKPLFGHLLSYETAYTAEQMVYACVFHANDSQDFYTYAAAARLLPARNTAARRTLLRASQNHRITNQEYAHGRSVIAHAGVYPFCFLPKGSPVEVLPNPLKLIERKITTIWLDRDKLPSPIPLSDHPPETPADR
ncbi:MAG: hypothetical protein ACI4O7_12795 [Aristaeellaceae bacterium]